MTCEGHMQRTVPGDDLDDYGGGHPSKAAATAATRPSLFKRGDNEDVSIATDDASMSPIRQAPPSPTEVLAGESDDLPTKQTSTRIPTALVNDMYYGYVDRFIFENNVTWMEMTAASAFWTSMTIFTMSRIPQHLMYHRLFQGRERVGFRGHVFSAPMSWREVQQQMDRIDQREAKVALPHVGAVLASIVHVQISGGLVELSRHIKEITVRRQIVERLILTKKECAQHAHAYS